MRKLILDIDPGVDDAVALIMALFEPSLDVVAVTAVSGTVGAEQVTRNVQALVDYLDPPRWPRIGAALEPENASAMDRSALYGRDGLCGVDLPVAELHHRHASEKVLTDELRLAPEQVTIATLGPLSNVAQVLRRDPSLVGRIGQLHLTGGTFRAGGDVTPAAEFNMYCDPAAARDVFRSRTTKTLVPLDVSAQVVLTLDHLEQLPSESTRVGSLLRRMLTAAYRAHRQRLGQEGLILPGAVSLAALLHPELFTRRMACGDVESAGEITQGATVFDHRPLAEGRANVEVAVDVDAPAVIDVILRGLALAAA